MQTESETEIEIGKLEHDVDRFYSLIRTECTEIAGMLYRHLGQNGARINASQRRLTALSRDVAGLRPRLGMIEARLMRDAAQQAEAEGGRPVLPQRWYDLRVRANRLQSDMNLWHEVGALISRQIPPKATPLYYAYDGRPEPLVTQAHVSDALFTSLHKLLNPLQQSEESQQLGCFEDIGLANSVFLEHAHVAYRVFLAQRHRHPARFLDVGCGVGLKVVSALEFFPSADGLEYDAGYARTSKALFKAMGLAQCGSIHGDAVSFDKYADYDVIYFYRPMRNEEGLKKMENQIVEHARPGTILIAPYLSFAARHQSLNCGQIGGSVFIAGLSQKETDELARAAEFIGPHVKRRETRVPSIWEPVLAASHANGHGIPRATRITV
ncbi:hypothetical protein [Meridianimarinicoccus aquatilis]|uniref:Uncharacterized protein n=1 Tax=Meridianimarinicoccus aquatilis TaxID=2552766 RepID=A0A4V3BB57_9RHOB|nr:hypothetical protein [Fluviibacterium aquatile]TDL85489.1 hypothetical protein E2L05_15365 [Fluviibacterium aquatile]